MNKIFKKIWSESRGCFVVVSETASSISRSKGKVTSLVLVTFLTASNVCALTTHNGDVELGTLRDGEKRTLMTWNPPPALSGRMDLSKSTKEEKFHAKKKNTRKKH